VVIMAQTRVDSVESVILVAVGPPGIRPKPLNRSIREYLYSYAAVCPALGKMTSLILPYANTEMMNIFLKQVSDDFNNYFVLMLVDQAGWHKAMELKVPETLRFIEQPSHSPELNPAEHLWDDLREKEFHNEAFGSLGPSRTCIM